MITGLHVGSGIGQATGYVNVYDWRLSVSSKLDVTTCVQVPSVWSAREFWPGDNYALALAYFQVGLPDGAFELLQGNLMHDMYRYMSPGALGSHNGG